MDRTGTCDLSRWYVVHTKTRQETRVESNLRRWGVTTFVPRIRERRRSSRRRALKECITPLFPSYIFVRCDGAALLDRVRFVRGVRRVLGFGEYATPVEDVVIAMLLGRLGDDGFVHLSAPRPGDVVTIVDGPMRSLVGVFERDLRAQDRVLVLMTWMARQARVELSRDSIRRVGVGLSTPAADGTAP